jgi:hypothetical protein
MSWFIGAIKIVEYDFGNLEVKALHSTYIIMMQLRFTIIPRLQNVGHIFLLRQDIR